ncbi:MAG: hypothetical protein QW400_03435 [Candidatus Diapherotrites archaeon]
MNKRIVNKSGILFLLVIFAGLAYACTYACTTCPNTPPSKPNVYITPSNPTTNDDLYCYANSYDPECDTLTYHYRWYRDGVLYTTQSTTSNYSSISKNSTNYSETWRCVVKAFDGRDYSEENSDSVTIQGEPCIDFEITTGTDSVTMKRNDTKTLSFWLRNKGNYSICINLRTSNSSSYIESWASRESVCLNAYESKQLSLTIKTNNASVGYYSVKIRGEGCYTREKEITVKVEEPCQPPQCCPYPPCYTPTPVPTCGTYYYPCYTPTPTPSCQPYCGQPIEIVPIRTSVCQESKGTISVLVKNLTNNELVVRLESSSVGFSSSFEQSAVVLSANQEKYVNLNVYMQCQSGEQYVTIYGKVDGYTLQRRANFTVISCPKPETRNFSIEVPVACTSMQKMQNANIAFTVKNLSRYSQTVNLQAVSSIVSEVDQTSVTLGPYESKTVYVRAYARETDKPGKQYITLYGWQDSYKEKKELCVEVQQMHKTLVSLVNNDIKIPQCSYGVFTMTVHNAGDTVQNYKISTNNPTKATIKFSESSFSLYPGEAKEVFITVNVPVDMPLAKYSTDIVVENSSVWVRTIYFDVTKGSETPSTAPVEGERPVILSYPVNMAIIPGTEKQFSIVLHNPTSRAVTVSIDFGLPQGLYSQTKSVYLAPGATETVITSIGADAKITPDRHYDGLLRLRFENTEVSKPVSIYVETVPASQDGAAIGLLTLENPWVIGLIIVVAFIAIVLILNALGGRQKKAEFMLYRR